MTIRIQCKRIKGVDIQAKDRVRHIDGRTGTVMACPVNADGFLFVRVVFDDGDVETLEPGYFEKIPEAFSV